MEKKFYSENVFLLKKTFFTEKITNENVKNIHLISEICFYTKYICVTNKIQIFLKYKFILPKKKFLIIKNIFVKTCELSNLVLKVSEAANLWYSFN